MCCYMELLDRLWVWLQTEHILPILIAAILGGVVGFERQLRRKAAGLRTNMLICMGAALFTLLTKETGVSSDSLTRVIQGIATGVGFLGAGVMIHQGTDIHGITTAATIWLVTAVGVACGLGLYGMAIMTIVMAIIVLAGMSPIEKKMQNRLSKQGSNGQ